LSLNKNDVHGWSSVAMPWMAKSDLSLHILNNLGKLIWFLQKNSIQVTRVRDVHRCTHVDNVHG